jgi:hypothetical protein
VLDRLSSRDWRLLMSAARYQTFQQRQTKEEHLSSELSDMPNSISPRLACFMMTRLNSAAEIRVWQVYLQDYVGDDLEVLSASMRAAVQHAEEGRGEWVKALPIVRLGYRHGITYPRPIGKDDRSRSALSPKVAKQICAEPESYPLALVGAAEAVLAAETGAEAIPVGKIAARDEWFVSI